MSDPYPIIGTIDFQWGGQPRQARLRANLMWECPIQTLQRFLQSEFTSYSPADGYPGARLLHDAAAFLSGQATWLAPDEAPATRMVVY